MALETDKQAVEGLVNAALLAMEGSGIAYGDRELLSAAYTVCLRCLKACVKNNELLRPSAQACAQLLLLELEGSFKES